MIVVAENVSLLVAGTPQMALQFWGIVNTLQEGRSGREDASQQHALHIRAVYETVHGGCIKMDWQEIKF